MEEELLQAADRRDHFLVVAGSRVFLPRQDLEEEDSVKARVVTKRLSQIRTWLETRHDVKLEMGEMFL